MDDLANALKIDPAISARLLRIVNSPLYGFPKQIDSITRAVNLIGMQAVSDLVAASTIGRTCTGMTSDLMDLSSYWHKSVLCAMMAGKIAKASGIEDSERFFIAGLFGISATCCSIKPCLNGPSQRSSKLETSTHHWRKWSKPTSGATSPKSARS